ncbi:hypothetical protein HJA89_21445 [Rhizobium bangladeshense]|uniref:hypothetical protein n=1 Tax=Rhizobium bangladeshense TaxID=1138189 RepID=UPI001C828F2F|nr:hypothetical protein [Rhizobium bangladeshense]MBX4875434.1 hypothetical protein [Rhizobium bangladeshense]
MSEHHQHHHRSLRDVYCDPADDNVTPLSSADATSIDAAGVIGLALACVRQGSEGSPSVPVPVMARLEMLADHGDPACRMVRNWIRGRRARSRSRAASPKRHGSSERPIVAEINSVATPKEAR